MYTVDHRDRVIGLKDLPQCSVGAPCPVVLASEHRLTLAYLVEDVPDDWDGSSARVVGPDSHDEPAAVVTFSMVKASMFGPPNDEAFGGHPLAARGLEPYGAFEVLDSSWLRRLEIMNRVHPSHQAGFFGGFRHFVLSFHDSTFECIARGYAFEITQGPLTAVIARAVPGLAL